MLGLMLGAVSAPSALGWWDVIRVRGSIIDLNGAGIYDVTVSLKAHSKTWSSRTDATGKFIDLPWWLVLWHDQYTVTVDTYTNYYHRLDSTLLEMDTDLHQKIKVLEGPILGRVMVGSKGLAGVRVTDSVFGRVAYTDNDGKYVLTNLSAPTVVSLSHPGSGFTFNPNSRPACPGHVHADFATVTGPIGGRVTLLDEPMPGVTVQYYRPGDRDGAPTRQVTTDVSGWFRVPDLSATITYKVRPVLAGFGFTPYEEPGKMIGTTNLQFRVSSGPIRGFVRNRNVGLENVTVVARSADTGSAYEAVSSAAAEARGWFAFADLPVGLYELVPQPVAGLLLPTVWASVGTNLVSIDAGFQIAGRVTAEDNASIGVASVVIEAWTNHLGTPTCAARTVTAANGHYSLSGLEAGLEYTVTATQPGLELPESPLTVRLDTPRLEQNFTARSLIQGRVTWAGGGLAGVTVTAADAEGAVAGTATTDAAGAYRLAVAYGTPRLTVTPRLAGFEFSPASLSARPGPTAVDVDFHGLGGIHGRISYLDGTGAAGVRVTAAVATNTSLTDSTTTDARGDYRFLSSAAGLLILEPQRVGYAFAPATMETNTGAMDADFRVTQSPPTISPINDQYLARDVGTPELAFTVGDREQAAGDLEVTAASSNTNLVWTNVVFSLPPHGAHRTVRITPVAGQSGTAAVTLTVDDGHGGLTSMEFMVNVDVLPVYAVVVNTTGEGLVPTLTNSLPSRPGWIVHDVDTNRWGAVGDAGGYAFLYRDGRAYDLNDVIPADSVWTLTNAYKISEAGEIFGEGIWGSGTNRISEFFHLIPAVVAGTAVPQPATAVARLGGPEITILENRYHYEGTNFFLWSEGDQKLFALAGGIAAEISWPTSVVLTDPGRTNQAVRTEWPQAPQVHVVGAPVELEPPEVPGFPYGFFAVPFTSAGVVNVDAASGIFNAPRRGYSVLQYYVTGGAPLDPQRQRVYLRVVKSLEWKDPPFDTEKNPTPCAIGQAITPVNRPSRAVVSHFANTNLFEIAAKVPGARLDGVRVEFRRVPSAAGPTAAYDVAQRELVLETGTNALPLSLVLDAVNALSHCPYQAEPPSSGLAGGMVPSNNLLYFDGAAACATVPHRAAFNANLFTLSLWINTTQTKGDVALVSKLAYSPTTNGYQISLRNGEARARYYAGDGTNRLVGTDGWGLNGGWVADGRWHHLALVVRQNPCLFYVDGLEADRGNWPGSYGPHIACTNGEPLTLGSLGGTSQFYEGALDEAAMWSTDLSRSQIVSSMTNPAAVMPGSLAGYWAMNEGSGWVLHDAAPVPTDGTLSHEPVWMVAAPAITADGLQQQDDYPGRSGFVLFENALYDGVGPDRAYDRTTRRGLILPVNRVEAKVRELVGDQTNKLVVVWHRRDAIGIAWPDLPVLYDPQWPAGTESIVIAWQNDAPVQDPALCRNLRIYHQPDLRLPGFNPNEEHAAIVEGKVTALRDDLNRPPPDGLGLSQPYVLMKYQDAFTGEWRMKVFAVIHQTPEHPFLYPQQAAREIQPPFPLNLLSLCAQTTNWSGPLWRDCNGKIYAYAAGPGLSRTQAVIRYYYPLQPGFYYDLNGDGAEDAPVGACVPWLCQWSLNKADPIDVTYDIRWPDSIPTLQIGSTLVTARDGLPEIHGQARAEVLFEGVNPVYTVNGARDVPAGYATNSGVRLYDPLSERTVDAPRNVPLPSGVETRMEAASGRKLFAALPYHLRCRFLYDELGRKLIFRGCTIYKDQPPQDPLLLPNVLTMAEKETIRTNLFTGVSEWQDKLDELYVVTRNPNAIDIDGQRGRDRGLYVGLTTEYVLRGSAGLERLVTNAYPAFAAGAGLTVVATNIVTEPLGDGPKALTAALPLTEAAAALLHVAGPNRAIGFHAPNAAFERTNVTGLGAGDAAHTVEAWVRVEARPVGTAQALLLALGDENGSPHRWWIDRYGRVSFGVDAASNVTVSLPAQQWIHLATSYDGPQGTYHLHINGVPAAHSTRLRFDLQGIPLSLAKPDGPYADTFQGAVTEIRIWNRARSAEEIQRDSHLALRGNETGLIAYWRADEGSGTTVADASGYGNTARLTSAAWEQTGTPLVRQANGYVTLAFNNDPALPGLPVTLTVIRVDPANGIYAGDLRLIASDNIFDERLTFRHSADFGFTPEAFEFQWYYHPGGETNPIPNTESQVQSYGWLAGPRGPSRNAITLGQGGEAGVLVISDNRWIMRYRPLPDSPLAGVLGTNWSPWAGAPNKTPKEAMLAEGWIKRVTQALNPFDARTDDFRNSEVNTFASLLVSAGRRYEGDIAFNPDADNVNKVGLIEAYQTVLNRGRNLSIDAEIESAPANEALLHASGKIADLYTMLGNEAYADAEDPTIGFTTPDGQVGTLAPSLFAFQNQLDSLLEEELALLRGLDQNLGRPAYNRLPWNFTHGDGQVAYQQIYDIVDTQTRDPVTGGMVLPDGFIDVNDAATLYPQGHGDAWGHYLTAIKTYYTLLRATNFQWQPRTEHVLLAGVPVEVDYEDERRFAAIAAAKAKTGAEIVNLTYRRHYVDDPAGQWQGYKDTDSDRAWGVDEWGRRAGQGAYFDWVVANAILPAEDTAHTGIEKIDRATVPELSGIASEYESIQSQLDQADVGLNPVGLAKGAVPFDIDPAFIASSLFGASHFEQIYQRALKAMNNAVTVFNHANDLTKNLRRTQDSSTDFARNVESQERDYQNRLITIFGYPYSGDIGPGKLYASGYDGPDLIYYNYVDETELTGKSVAGPADTITVLMRMVEAQIAQIPERSLPGSILVPVTYPLSDSVWRFTVSPGSRGTRRAGGELQTKVSDILQSHANYEQALHEYQNTLADIQRKAGLLQAQYNVGAEKVSILRDRQTRLETLNDNIQRYNNTEKWLRCGGDALWHFAETPLETIQEAATSEGFGADAVSKTPFAVASTIIWAVSEVLQGVATGFETTKDAEILKKEEMISSKDIDLQIADNRYEVQQLGAELEARIRDEVPQRIALFGLREKLLQELGNYEAKLAEGLRLLDERDAFRRSVAGQVSENRYRDLAFRVFRNDAIQKYRAQFDLAARYVYLAATAYDYETTMLGNQTGAGRQFLTDIVRQRALGEWVNDQPVVGRHGLADSLGRLAANWAILKTQLGINNPEHEDGFFSLRSELFRTRPEGFTNAVNLPSDRDWALVLRDHGVPNLWDIPEFRRYCRPFAPESAGPQPGLVIPFATTVNFGLNVFGWPLGPSDGAYDSSRFATKIRSTSILFPDYPAALSRTPRIYLVPVGTDILRAASGTDTTATREFKVVDQKIPVPFPIGYTDVNNPAYLPERDSLSGSFIDIRRYSSFHAFPGDAAAFDPDNDALTESRLVGRSVWNTRWLLIIPGGTFLFDPHEGLETFVASISDITLYFRTYSYSGN
ncbi:MAG: carboxypeptidase regulatory-like domain-containing protein [Verrucomicrobia bacterium]|nr:carboxypeptidase regulatory-like domain-containing protein [Verrucomicrobiota bacterium]